MTPKPIPTSVNMTASVRRGYEARRSVSFLRVSGRLELVVRLLDDGPEFPMTCGIVYCRCGSPHEGYA